MKSIFITTTIPYVNARPHLGFALELVQADCLTRFYRQIGASLRFQTGTDENARKNVEAARKRDIPPQEWVDRHAGFFHETAVALGVNFDDFVRTTESRHHNAVDRILSRLDPADLEKRPYKSLYCTGCEDFWPERDAPDLCCPEHRIPLARIEEDNIFFRLSRYQSELLRLIETDTIRITLRNAKTKFYASFDAGCRTLAFLGMPRGQAGGESLFQGRRTKLSMYG